MYYRDPQQQKLVDICFEVASMISDKEYRHIFDEMSHEEKMEWVAKQLSGCGFKTRPCGCSWGVLVGDDE